MHARFRIRTREGEDLAPGTVEEFSELVRSGGLRPEDLVFDALTGEWAPARSHPIVHLFSDPLAVEPPAGKGPPQGSPPKDPSSPESQPGSPPTVAAAGDAGELNLDLVEFDEASPEEEARAFIAKMEEERRSDSEVPPLLQDEPLLDASVGSVVGLVPDAPQAAPAPADPEPPDPELRAPAPRAPTPRAPTPRAPTPRAPAPRAPTPAPAPTAPVPVERTRPEARPTVTPLESREGPRRRPSAARYQSRRWKNGAILGFGAMAVALSMLWPLKSAVDPSEGGIARAEEAREAPRTVPITEDETRAAALSAYVDAIRALGEEMAVGDVPRMWLEGQYLADPEAYPEVRRYWERYLDFLDAARAAEVTLYRGAYLIAAADAGLSGPVRSLRLAAAQEAFAAGRDRRDILYGRVERLPLAALALDDLLVDLVGRVTYEPIAGPRLSADPVIEAAGVDAEAQALLEAALDQVLSALQGPGGVPTRDRAGVPEWLAVGLEKVEGAR